MKYCPHYLACTADGLSAQRSSTCAFIQPTGQNFWRFLKLLGNVLSHSPLFVSGLATSIPERSSGTRRRHLAHRRYMRGRDLAYFRLPEQVLLCGMHAKLSVHIPET